MQSVIVEESTYRPLPWTESNRKLADDQRGGHPGYLIYKRAMDITISLLVVLLVFPWLLPIIGLLIKLDSRGPVFFRQKRVGFLGKQFWCLKFRTMRFSSNADTVRASKDDPRITDVGRFLRNTCLDEIPQFINVLIGQMSITGPRPHMLKDTEEFSNLISDYRFRHFARPGITGLSQVKGLRGPAKDLESISRRYYWDSYYVRNISFLLDMNIMIQTALLMLKAVLNPDQPVSSDDDISPKGKFQVLLNHRWPM